MSTMEAALIRLNERPKMRKNRGGDWGGSDIFVPWFVCLRAPGARVSYLVYQHCVITQDVPVGLRRTPIFWV